jgi:hypothetical protein
MTVLPIFICSRTKVPAGSIYLFFFLFIFYFNISYVATKQSIEDQLSYKCINFLHIQIEAVDLNYAMPLELLAMADRGELQYSLVYI